MVIDDFTHPNDISIEQMYCHYTDIMTNKMQTMNKSGKISDSTIPFLKNVRLLAQIKRSEIIKMDDYYDEILGMSTKEMTLSENVSIPDLNKRKLCNIETLTNKRCQSDILSLDRTSSEGPNMPRGVDTINNNFYSEREIVLRGSKVSSRPELVNFNTPTEIHGNKYKTRRTLKHTYNYDPRNPNHINKSIEFNSKYGMLSANRNHIKPGSHRKTTKAKIDFSKVGGKYSGCLSSKHSTNNLLSGDQVEPFKLAKHLENDHQIKDKEDVYINSSNLSASGSKFNRNRNSINKDNDSKVYTKNG